MIDPDYVGNNTSNAEKAQRKADNLWLLMVALIVGGFTFFTWVFWSY